MKEEQEQAANLLVLEQERLHEVERVLGIRPWPQSEVYKEGRYWVGVSRWTDPRDQKEYALKTHKNASGELVSELGRWTYPHNKRSANKDVVPSCHLKVREYVFVKLVKAYVFGQNSPL